MIECVIAAPSSGSGKTAVTCGILELLRRRGTNPCAFKCGPDYIDPMFHRSVLGMDSWNLDLFLSDEAYVRRSYAVHTQGHGAAVCEGVMGLYDGVGGTTTQASAWHVADTLGLPVILVLRPKGVSLTLAAQLRGLHDFRAPSRLVGVILNECSPMLFRSLAPMLERETGLAALGYLPHMEEAVVESRHLGLYTASEITDWNERIAVIADTMEQTIDMARLCALCTTGRESEQTTESPISAEVRIAVARDEAFCFAYAETLECFRRCGAEIVPFSPLTDGKLPENVYGLYLPGGYPELHVRELSENRSMRESVRNAVTDGLPTVAECGGFLYLGHSLTGEDGVSYSMAGVLDGDAVRQARLVRFGYANVTAEHDSLLFRAGECVPAHEFHYWDSTENGADLLAVKPVSGRRWRCGVTTPTLYAGFPHLYFAGNPQLARRFVDAAWKRREEA